VSSFSSYNKHVHGASRVTGHWNLCAVVPVVSRITHCWVVYIFSLTLPHSTAVQLAWPDQALHNGGCLLLLCVCVAELQYAASLAMCILASHCYFNSSAASMARPSPAQR
jgi:hypothetical protein